MKEGDGRETTEPSGWAILTSVTTGRPVGLCPTVVGEIVDISASNEQGVTRLVSRRSRRVVWRVREPDGDLFALGVVAGGEDDKVGLTGCIS